MKTHRDAQNGENPCRDLAGELGHHGTWRARKTHGQGRELLPNATFLGGKVNGRRRKKWM